MKSAKIHSLLVPNAQPKFVPECTGFSSAAQEGLLCANPDKMALDQSVSSVSDTSNVVPISKAYLSCCDAKKVHNNSFTDELNTDLELMTKMQLRNKYSGEANCHRNMMSRQSKGNAKVHSNLREFRDFLSILGPKPIKSATVDRIDNNDPEYAPGKVRWADKKTQNSNKGDSLVFSCSIKNRNYTASELALKQHVSASAIRSRRKHGWSDSEIISGKRAGLKKLQGESVVVKKNGHHTPHTAQPMSGAEIMFERLRRSCKHHRETEGEEHFILTPVEMLEINDGRFLDLCSEESLEADEDLFLRGRLRVWWADYKPHVLFDELKPFQQDWVRRLEASQGQKM